MAFGADGAEFFVPGDHDTIQAAIDGAADGDTVTVAPGVYEEAIDFRGRLITVRALAGPEFTVIDASDLDAAAVTCVSGETRETVLEGFTVTGGSGDDTLFGQTLGGGMYNVKSSPTVRSCVFFRNSATGGGGMSNLGGSPLITDCAFVENSASFSNGGGGMRNAGSNPVISNCAFRDNTSGFDGGGMHNLGGSPVISNCLFTGNTADIGAGIRNSGSNPTIVNCTLVGNVAVFGGGMRSSSGGTIDVRSTVLWNNLPDQVLDLAGAVTTVSFSVVDGGWKGPGGMNTDEDPRFVDPAAGNFRLRADSPCIDRGNARRYVGPPVDLDGNPRFWYVPDLGALDPGAQAVGSALDMGAFEYITPAKP